MTLKHIWARDFIVKIKSIILALEAANNAGLKRESLSAAFRYVIDAKEKEDVMLFFDKIVSSKLYKYKGEIMTYAETLRQEGRQKGWQEGRQEGAEDTQQKIAINMLHSGFKPEEVAKCTGIPLQTIKNLQKSKIS